MTRNLSVATYPHSINAIKHYPLCTQCDQGGSQTESLSHFLSTCPKFHHATTAPHNQVCKVLVASLHKHLAANWSLDRETPLSQTGLVLELAPTAIVLQTAVRETRFGFRHCRSSELQMSLGRWPPDLWQYPTPLKLGPEVCRPSDTRPDNLFEACSRRLQTYEPVRFSSNSASKIHCLRMDRPGPSMGRGYSGTYAWTIITRFAEIPWFSSYAMFIYCPRFCMRFCWSSGFMCRLHFSPSLQNRTFDTDDPKSYLTMDAADQRSGRKCKAIANEKSLISTFQRWSKILPPNQCYSSLDSNLNSAVWRALTLSNEL